MALAVITLSLVVVLLMVLLMMEHKETSYWHRQYWKELDNSFDRIGRVVELNEELDEKECIIEQLIVESNRK